MRTRSRIGLILGFALAVGVGYRVARTAAPDLTGPRPERPRLEAPQPRIFAEGPETAFRSHEREAGFREDEEAAENGALPNQRAIVFASREALERFLANAGSGVVVLDRLDALNALRVGFLNAADLAALLDGSEETSMIFPVSIPDQADVPAQAGATGLGSRLLDWLGISGDHSDWGTGVRIAVLDTGIAGHSAFASLFRSINLVEPGERMNGHGTAVASLIGGSHSLTPGVAPGAELLSVRVANDNGQSDSFLLASGILAAVEAGVHIINISLGSHGDSTLVRQAVQAAQDAGIVIVASGGNDGHQRVSYPAAYEGVIAVAAVDAGSNHLAFSNTGNQIAVAAPGYQVNAAWPGESAIGFSGTSASAPIVSGAIAATMTHAGNARLSPTQAANLVLGNLNDAGAPGVDPALGGGTVDLGRVMNAGTPGIYDAALASHWVLEPTDTTPYPQLQVTVQNRGTEPLVNTMLQVSTGGGTVPFNITQLSPGAIRTFNVPLPAHVMMEGQSLRVESAVQLGGGQPDSNPSNDRRVDLISRPDAP